MWYLAMMSGQAGTRVLLVDAGQPIDVFDVVEITNDLARVRTSFLFELGEELTVRIEEPGATFEAAARVRAHVGPADDKITELELDRRSPV